jgi:hypothetical protein
MDLIFSENRKYFYIIVAKSDISGGFKLRTEYIICWFSCIVTILISYTL